MRGTAMSSDIRDSLGILLAVIVFCCLVILLKWNVLLSVIVALGAGLALVFVLSKQEKKRCQ